MRISDWSSDVCSSDLSSLHARQRLAIDVVAGLWAVEYVSGHQHEAGTFASRRGRKRIDRVQPRFEQSGARLFRCASERLAELPVRRVNETHWFLRFGRASFDEHQKVRSEEHTSELQSPKR